ncbi:MAG: right-handed parallel beta-helix repeat-containing protein [Paludibacteraceae bacterium]|nr:right-handed parallel beta-helix repeat-containing protein [Paludibacteraceae bacterium]
MKTTKIVFCIITVFFSFSINAAVKTFVVTTSSNHLFTEKGYEKIKGSFAAAIDSVNAYPEDSCRIVFSIPKTESDTVTLNNYVKNLTITNHTSVEIDGDGIKAFNNATGDYFSFNGAKGIILRNLNFIKSTSQITAISTQFELISNCTFSGSSSFYGALSLRDTSKVNIIENCLFTDNSYAIINTSGSSFSEVKNCIFKDNGIGISAKNTKGRVTNCKFYNHSQYSISSLNGTIENSLFDNSTIQNGSSLCADAVIKNDTFYNCPNALMGYANNVTNCYFRNNTNCIGYSTNIKTLESCTFEENATYQHWG